MLSGISRGGTFIFTEIKDFLLFVIFLAKICVNQPDCSILFRLGTHIVLDKLEKFLLAVYSGSTSNVSPSRLATLTPSPGFSAAEPRAAQTSP